MNEMINRKEPCLVVIALFLGLLLTSCAHLPTAGERAAGLGSAFLEESGISGLAISVGMDQEIIWSQGFGFADLEQQVPVDPALTRFRVGSTAKSMTAMALGQLYEAGRLNLDAPVQAYLPDYPEKEGAITTRLLAGHLAGIRHYRGDEFLSAVPYATVADGLEIFQHDPLEAPPGTKYVYSTYGFNLISAVIESAAGRDFPGYMSEYVFVPLGMSRTTPDRVVPIIDYRSRYYHLEDGKLVNSPWVDNSNKWAGGGFLSTSEDLVRFGFAHLTDRHLRPETIAMMWTSQATASGEETGYGIGWNVGTDEQGRRLIRHGGGSVGGTTELRIYPQYGLVIGAISNTSNAGIGPLADSVAELFMDEERAQRSLD